MTEEQAMQQIAPTLQTLGQSPQHPEETQHGTTIVLHGIRIFIPHRTPPEFIHEASLFLDRVYLQESADCGGS